VSRIGDLVSSGIDSELDGLHAVLDRMVSIDRATMSTVHCDDSVFTRCKRWLLPIDYEGLFYISRDDVLLIMTNRIMCAMELIGFGVMFSMINLEAQIYNSFRMVDGFVDQN
tara:strand:+ start:586 stop:921 length:336 start_codon:yes stop_codon:yes gene_type:complete